MSICTLSPTKQVGNPHKKVTSVKPSCSSSILWLLLMQPRLSSICLCPPLLCGILQSSFLSTLECCPPTSFTAPFVRGFLWLSLKALPLQVVVVRKSLWGPIARWISYGSLYFFASFKKWLPNFFLQLLISDARIHLCSSAVESVFGFSLLDSCRNIALQHGRPCGRGNAWAMKILPCS